MALRAPLAILRGRRVSLFALLAVVACAGAVGRVWREPGSARVVPLRPSSVATGEPAGADVVTGSETGDPLALANGEARLALSERGTVGAWLVAGAFERARSEEEETRLVPVVDQALGGGKTAPRWRSVCAANGVINVAAAIDDSNHFQFAYAGGTLHVGHDGTYFLLLGTDDGVTVRVDGRSVFHSDRPRPRRDDDDLIPVALATGDHPLVLALHRRGRPQWSLRVRVLDADLGSPSGAWWELPGTSAADARALAGQMSSVEYDRGVGAGDYHPRLTVHYRAGTPLDVPITGKVRLIRSAPTAASDALIDVEIRSLPRSAASPDDRVLVLPRVPAAAVEDDDWTAHIDISGRSLELPFRPRRAVREAIERARTAVGRARALGDEFFGAASLDTVDFLRERLAGFAAKGDSDVDADVADARELDTLSASLEQRRDPYVSERSDAGAGGGESAWRTGPMRRAYVSPVDGHFSEFALYVPPDFDPRRTYPLVVALHGMNGHPMQMLMWLFGHDDPVRDALFEDRHPVRDLEPVQAIVVAPDGHFNAMYRDLGEDDVFRVIDWALSTYPIDPGRVTITGPSMGGIGAAACALHSPSRFAAAEALCGYHSYLVRSDVVGKPLRPWERFIAEQRSNAAWAENGLHLPLHVVHGTKDLPTENSGVLIDRYEALHYEVEHEHPELGHNVWQANYEDLKGLRKLITHRRPPHPRTVRFKTTSTRWADDAWVHVRELSSTYAWGEVVASVDARNNRFRVTTRGVAAIELDRDTERIDDAAAVAVAIDGDALTFQAGQPLLMHRSGEWGKATWSAGPAVHAGLFKHGTITGPIGDVFHEPILFVWGASDPTQRHVNEEVAREWARVRWGVRVDYPVISDDEFFVRGEALANNAALFLVGNAKSNRVVRELEPSFPIRVDGDGIVVGTERIAVNQGAGGSQLGAAFIRPNPLRPDRYVVVVEGVGPLGTLRSLSLPELLPDYVVFDEAIAPARGQPVLGSATTRAGGAFTQDWTLNAPH